MPLYEYECTKKHRFEMYRSIDRRHDPIHCKECRGVGRLLISGFTWHMGWKFLKDKSEKSPPAPTDSGYHPEWDEAYSL